MAHWKPVDDIQAAANVLQDLVNKHGGKSGIKRFLSGELVLVERNASQVSVGPQQGLANGGVTYASALNIEAFLEDWSEFLKKVFRVGLPSRKKIILPKQTRIGFGWGVLTLAGMTIEQVLVSYADICPIWRWTDNNLDEITKSVRSINRSARVVWFRDRVEADEEHKDKSYNDLQTEGVGGITLLERLLLGRWFHYKVGQHLDVINVTRCDGSRFSDGVVPGVGFDRDDGWLYVDGYDPDFHDANLRSREAVS